MSKIQKMKNLKGSIKKYILSFFILLILTAYFSKILLYQNCQANKNQSGGVSSSLVTSFDTLCFLNRFLPFFQIPPLEEVRFSNGISNEGEVFARPIFTPKRLIDHSKLYLDFTFSLLKYRFFKAKNSLEGLQAKKNEGLKIIHSPDNLRFIRGLVLGEKSSEAGYMTAFENAGMLHVLVASGFNIALVASATLVFVRNFPRVQRFFLVLGSIWGYAAYLNFEPPLLRAASMFSLLLCLQFFGIRTKKSRVLLGAMAMILWFQPDLISSLSLWLSSLATLGIFVFAQRLSLFWQEGGAEKGIFKIFLEESATSFSAQSLIFPLLVWFFHSVNLVSFLANPVMLPWLGNLTQLSALEVMLSFADSFWLTRVLLMTLSSGMEVVFRAYFFAVAWWQNFFFLNFSPTPGETRFVLVVWLAIIAGMYRFVRKKPEEKGIFFHEKA